jgi:phosphatidate cytidylyltransferase
MKNLLIRALSGAVYVLVVMFACFSGSMGQVLLAGIITIFAVIEWMHFGENRTLGLSTALVVTSVFLAIYIYTGVFEIPFIQLQLFKGLLVVVIGSILISQGFHSKSIPQRLFHSTFALLYIGVPMIILPMIPNYQGENYPWMLASVFILIWCNDTFAYLTGSTIGKHKLFPRISPNKTWEGFLGGITSTILGAFIFSNFFTFMPFLGWLGLAFVVLIFGTLGDLFESSLKRSYGIKDSGKFMPGHGGILDRIDSLLFAIPMAYFYLRIFETLH